MTKLLSTPTVSPIFTSSRYRAHTGAHCEPDLHVFAIPGSHRMGSERVSPALDWDGRETDATDFSLDSSDLPLLTRLIGTLTVNYVDDLDYTQYIVNGILVDPASIARADYSAFTVITAAGYREDEERNDDGQWTTGAGSSVDARRDGLRRPRTDRGPIPSIGRSKKAPLYDKA